MSVLLKKGAMRLLWGSKEHALPKKRLIELVGVQNIDLSDLAFLKKTVPELDSVLVLDQVHGTAGVIFDAIFTKSNGVKMASEYQKEYQADYSITACKGLGLTIATADCLPVSVYDPDNQVIGMIHLGWAGAVKGALFEFLETITCQYNSQLSSLLFFLGPSARACCYKIGQDVLEQIYSYPYGSRSVYTRDGQYFFDIPILVLDQLDQWGIGTHQADLTHAVCTICDDRWWSHRRDKLDAQRQINLVMLAR